MKKFQSIYGIDTTLLFHIIRKNMIVFLHEENDLPDNTNTNFEFSIYEIGDGREDIKARVANVVAHHDNYLLSWGGVFSSLQKSEQ